MTSGDDGKNPDLKSHAAELLRKAVTVGVGAAFLTEESLRSLVGEIKLPKEILGGILESAQKTKNEFLARLSTDLLEKVTSRLDPKAVIEELLERNEVELHVRLSLKPKAGFSKPASENREPPKRDDDPAEA